MDLGGLLSLYLSPLFRERQNKGVQWRRGAGDREAA